MASEGFDEESDGVEEGVEVEEEEQGQARGLLGVEDAEVEEEEGEFGEEDGGEVD